MRGLFITFEGPDGAGKTTQLGLLADALAAEGYDVVRTREPGGTRISDHIRAILLDPAHTEMADAAEVLLYAASRAQHVHERILPALAEGKIVLCDRFIDASMAYQAYGLGIAPETVRAINAFAAAGLKPDRTYMLDLSAEAGLERLRRRTQGGRAQGLDRIELKRTDYHRRVREAFLRIAREEPERVLVVDGEDTPERIHARIRDDCNRLLELRDIPRTRREQA
jgi:dTMP kinase